MLFEDRAEAGRRLAARLLCFKEEEPVVLALPRGGVPVGFEIARELKAPLGLVLVRKIGHPFSPEFAVGAVADGETPETFIDHDAAADVPSAYLEAEIGRQMHELDRQRRTYFAGHPTVNVRGRTALIVDDGIATGATMRAALRSVRHGVPKRVVVAVPVAPAGTILALQKEADEIVCLAMPENFTAVGLFYGNFRQVETEEVIDLLDRANIMGRLDHE